MLVSRPFGLALRLATLGMSPAHREEVCARQEEFARLESTGAERVLLVAQAATVERLGDQGLGSLVLPGLAVVSIGSMAGAGASGSVSGSYAATSMMCLALALVFGASQFKPRRAFGVSLGMAVGLIWQIATVETAVLADWLVVASMVVLTVSMLVTFRLQLKVALPDGGLLPRDLTRTRALKASWLVMAVALFGIAVGDACSVLTGPPDALVNIGLSLNAVGVGLIAAGIARALRTAPAPA